MKLENLPHHDEALLTTIEPHRTAVLAIHWQHGIVRPDDPFGSVFGPVIAKSGVLERVRAVVGAARAAGALVVHLNICNKDEIVATTPIFRHAAETGGLRCGSPEVRELDELSDPADLSFDHHRGSVFLDTPLQEVLTGRGIDTVVLTGVATNVAVENSARDAADRGFYAIVLEDCCVAGAQDRHDASIENLKVVTAGVVDSSVFLAAMKRQQVLTSDISAE